MEEEEKRHILWIERVEPFLIPLSFTIFLAVISGLSWWYNELDNIHQKNVEVITRQFVVNQRLEKLENDLKSLDMNGSRALSITQFEVKILQAEIKELKEALKEYMEETKSSKGKK